MHCNVKIYRRLDTPAACHEFWSAEAPRPISIFHKVFYQSLVQFRKNATREIHTVTSARSICASIRETSAQLNMFKWVLGDMNQAMTSSEDELHQFLRKQTIHHAASVLAA
jgi:hypothetical protein